MPTLTRLVQGKKNPNRVNLYLDDQFAFALSIDEVAKHGLKKGLELTDVQIESLKDNDETKYVFGLILNFLSYRPRTVKEVRDRLHKYDVRDKAKQDLLITKLQSKGYLDDAAFATWFIESRNAHRPRSTRMLKQELQVKGVPSDIVTTAMVGSVDESDTIARVLDKKLGVKRALEREEEQKIYTYLSRQGYAWDKIKEVVKTWQSE